MSVLSGSVRPALSNAARRWACEALPSPSRIRATSALRAWLIATMLLHPSNRPTSNIQTNLLIVTDEANPGFELGINHLKLARVARPLRQLRWLTTPRFYDESSYQSQGDNAVNIDREGTSGLLKQRSEDSPIMLRDYTARPTRSRKPKR